MLKKALSLCVAMQALLVLAACQQQPVTSNCKGQTRTLPIQAGGSYTNNNASELAKPGDTLVIPAGTYNEIFLTGLEGTPECPIKITNSGGLVRITANINFEYPTRHVRITGTGHADLRYGIRIGPDGPDFGGRFAIHFKGQGPFEADHLEIGYALMGIQAKINYECDIRGSRTPRSKTL